MSRYLQERDDFVSRVQWLLPWLTPARLTYLAYYADTERFDEVEDPPSTSVFSDVRMLRLPELRELGSLRQFKAEPPWIERRIPKGNGSGERTLYLPNTPLKQLHRFVLNAHLNRLTPDRAAYGFEAGRSRWEHAEYHCNQYVVVRVDIQSFFPSISVDRVEPIFEECGFRSRFSNVLAHLVTYHQRLPQGAPTSPKLADLVARPLDRKLRVLAKDRRWHYSRYADDLCFSCPREISTHEIGETIDAVEELVESEGFRLNHGKTRVMKEHNRQLVAGAVVNNSSPTAPREKRRKVKAIIHNCRKNGLVREAWRYHRKIKDEYGQPEVEKGRYPGEIKRSDRQWPYHKQAPFVPERYNDPLAAYPPEDWPLVYDFWHYLSGLVGEINALDPARGRQLRKELEKLQLGHTELSDDFHLDEEEERIQKFWVRTHGLIAEVNRELQSLVENRNYFAPSPLDPDAKTRVVRSEEEFLAFVADVYRQLYDSVDDLGLLKHLLYKEEELENMRFSFEFRHYRGHGEAPTKERERERLQVLRDGFERLLGKERPDDGEDWNRVHRTLCDGLHDDLKWLKDWGASR